MELYARFKRAVFNSVLVGRTEKNPRTVGLFDKLQMFGSFSGFSHKVWMVKEVK